MESDSSVGIGIIGAGKRIRSLMSLVLDADPRLEIVAVHDPLDASFEALSQLCRRAPKRCEGIRSVTDDPAVDWVVIGSWNCLHKDHTLAALHGGKHVFCEKPLATTIDDVLTLYQAWSRCDRKLFVGFTLRYSPHIVKIKRMIDEGAVGQIVSIEANEMLRPSHGGHIMSDWRRLKHQSGGHLLEKCCHDIDVLNWLVDSRASKVTAFAGVNVFTPQNAYLAERVGIAGNGRPLYVSWNQPEYTDPFEGEHDVMDNQVVLLEYENGVRASFHTNLNCAIQERRVLICGTEGTIRADVITGRIEYAPMGDHVAVQDCSTDARGDHGGGDEQLVQELIQAMTRGATPRSGAYAGACSAITCLAADDAVAQNQVLDLSALWKRMDGIDSMPPA